MSVTHDGKTPVEIAFGCRPSDIKQREHGTRPDECGHASRRSDTSEDSEIGMGGGHLEVRGRFE
eukprot:7670268-Prorocentrum_lima.AAC.1